MPQAERLSAETRWRYLVQLLANAAPKVDTFNHSIIIIIIIIMLPIKPKPLVWQP
jgi:hypothetical protein